MRPLIHVFSTVIIFFAVSVFTPVPVSVLVWACVLTVAVDVLDHGVVILTLKHPTIAKVRKLVLQKKFVDAYRLYYARRRYTLKFAFIHNIPVTAGIIYLTLYYQSMILALGLVLHLALDLVEHYHVIGDLEFWFK